MVIPYAPMPLSPIPHSLPTTFALSACPLSPSLFLPPSSFLPPPSPSPLPPPSSLLPPPPPPSFLPPPPSLLPARLSPPAARCPPPASRPLPLAPKGRLHTREQGASRARAAPACPIALLILPITSLHLHGLADPLLDPLDSRLTDRRRSRGSPEALKKWPTPSFQNLRPDPQANPDALKKWRSPPLRQAEPHRNAPRCPRRSRGSRVTSWTSA